MEPGTGNTVDEGLALHRAGKLPEAAAVYRRVLERDPSNADALHYLGVLASMQGDQQNSVDLITRAIALKPDAPKFHNNLGVALRELKRLAEAEAAFRRASQLQPDFADALRNLALILDVPERARDCLEIWQRFLALHPDFADGWNRLGIAQKELGLLEEAASSFREVTRHAPGSHIGFTNLAGALLTLAKYEAALEAAEEALKLFCNLAEAMSVKANALFFLNRRGDAEAVAKQLIELHPRLACGHLALACVQKAEARFEELLGTYRNVLELEPENALIHFDKGLSHLLLGQMEEGWAEHEWRLRVPSLRQLGRDIPCPRWTGEALHGRTILIHAEQGVGDTLNFLRYLPLAAARGGRVVFVSQPEIASFARKAGLPADVFVPGEPLPPFHCEAPLMSLPFIFGTTLETIPLPPPLPSLSTGLIQLSETKRPKVGLVWAGDPKHANDRNRSMALSLFEPLLDLEGIAFFSLQVGSRAVDCSRLTRPERLHDLSGRLTDYAATADVLGQLDLLISVDTSVVHLAGVLGRPVWTLLPFLPDWRWLLDREDSPWYPTMRLFRQRKAGDWPEVVQSVMGQLKAMPFRVR